MKWLLAPVALMVLGNGSAGAQTIAGRVIDAKSRLPLRLVTVQLFDDSGGVAATARTDTAGIFYGLLSAPGRFRLHLALDSILTFDSEPIAVEADGFVEREFVVPLLRVFTKSEVGKQVQTRADSPHPRYPSLLAAANIEGEVVAQFVVDTMGHADTSTFKVLSSNQPGFTQSVRNVLPDMRFYPAEIGGRKVNQMVQQPFTFKLTNKPLPGIEDWPPPEPRLPQRP
jgi:TonB family C-terminal domain